MIAGKLPVRRHMSYYSIRNLVWLFYLMNEIADFFFSSRRRHTRLVSDWSSDVCSSDLINIEKNISLLPYNTFGIQVKASFFCRIGSVPQLQELIASSIYKKEPRLILGEIGRASCRERV